MVAAEAETNNGFDFPLPQSARYPLLVASELDQLLGKSGLIRQGFVQRHGTVSSVTTADFCTATREPDAPHKLIAMSVAWRIGEWV